MILVDVDDIFVGERGTRLKKDDVMALLATQQRIQALVPGFKFNLGFSGKYFHHGTAEENLGDDMLLENVDRYVGEWYQSMRNGKRLSFTGDADARADNGMLLSVLRGESEYRSARL